MAGLGIRLGLALGVSLIPLARATAVAAGSIATTFANAPTYHYHPTTSTIATSGSTITNVSDLRGKAPLTTTSGPTLGTDGLGRKYMRFGGGQFLQNIADLTGQDPHNMTVFAVVRHFQMAASGKASILSVGTNGNTPSSHTHGQLSIAAGTSATRSQAPFVGGPSSNVNQVATQAPANRNRLITAANLQVIGISTATADGVGGAATSVTVRHYNMDQVAPLTATITRQAGKTGFEIGRRASGTGSTFDYFYGDIYELVGWTEGQFTSDTYAAASDAIQSAMMSNWGLVAYTASVILEGDSRTEQIAGTNFASMLTDPGSAVALPATTRVISAGVAGTGTIRAGNDGYPALGITGAAAMLGNGKDVVVDFQGFNDIFAATNSFWPTFLSANYTDARAQEIYNTTALDASFTAWPYAAGGIEVTAIASGFITYGQRISGPGIAAETVITGFVSGTNGGVGRYTTTQSGLQTTTSAGAAVSCTATMPTQTRNITEWLARGFKVIKAVETANDSQGQTAHAILRGLVKNNLTNDVAAGGGQTYAGKLRIADLPSITVSGSAIFGANAVLPGVYYSDATVHFTQTGRATILSGGDTPANGLRAHILAALA